MKFATCEFEGVEGVLRCLRTMNGLKIIDEELKINPSDKTNSFLSEWIDIKKNEYAEQNKDVENPVEFEKYLQKDDASALEKIHKIIARVRKSISLNKFLI